MCHHHCILAKQHGMMKVKMWEQGFLLMKHVPVATGFELPDGLRGIGSEMFSTYLIYLHILEWIAYFLQLALLGLSKILLTPFLDVWSQHTFETVPQGVGNSLTDIVLLFLAFCFCLRCYSINGLKVTRTKRRGGAGWTHRLTVQRYKLLLSQYQWMPSKTWHSFWCSWDVRDVAL